MNEGKEEEARQALIKYGDERCREERYRFLSIYDDIESAYKYLKSIFDNDSSK